MREPKLYHEVHIINANCVAIQFVVEAVIVAVNIMNVYSTQSMKRVAVYGTVFFSVGLLQIKCDEPQGE